MARTLELDTITEPGNSGTANITLSSNTTTTMPLVDINGGAIDGTTLGAGTPSSVAATTLTTSGNATFGNSADDATTVTGTLTVTRAATLNDNVSLGTSSLDVITVAGTTTINAVSGCNTVVGATSGNQTIDIASHDLVDGGLKLAGTLVTASAAELNALDGITSTVGELNIMDGGTSATGTTLADADRVVVNDGGTMKQVALTDFETYFETSLDTQPALTTVGALNAGSITSGFGTIDTGSSTITTTGALAAGTVNTGQGANELYDMDQNVLTTSAVTFATVNTGQGNHELYEMNQDVTTSDEVTFAKINGAEINGPGSSYNIGVGVGALNSLSSGDYNTALGWYAGYSITGNLRLTAVGYRAAYYNTGSWNTAIGPEALYTNTGSHGSTAVGFGASYYTTGGYCTSVGMYANKQSSANQGTGENNTCVGYNAHPNLRTGSNQVTIGNTSVTRADVEVAWSIGSDERDKNDIVPMTHGLDVIENINPINYVWDRRVSYWDNSDIDNIIKHDRDGSKKESDIQTGFSAQNVKLALDNVSHEGHSVVDSKNTEKFTITETKILPFLVNAIKELSAKVKALEAA